MSIAQVRSRAQVGIDAPLVTVEAHVANGLPAVTIVGSLLHQRQHKFP